MTNLEHYRMRVRYKGLEGLSEIGFKKRETLLDELFPTADEQINACFYKLDKAAAVISEVPDERFEVVETDRVLDLAMSDPKGDYVGLIIDVLGRDIRDAEAMMADIEATCGFVRTRRGEALRIMELSEAEALQRLKDSLKLIATELRE